MRLALHIGPHKTGTTSVQTYLLNSIGSRKPRRNGIWYPDPKEGGPGHSVLAYGAIKGESSHLVSVIEAARDAGVATLVLSSEAFSAAYPRKIANLGALLGEDVHLIVTLNSPLRRAAATWQELVKHAHTLDLQTSFRHLLKRPEYQQDFLTRFVDELKPKQTSIILSSADDPSVELLANVAKAIGLPAPRGKKAEIRVNTRASLIETQVLRSLNVQLAQRFPGFPRERYVVLRQLLSKTFESSQWRAACPQIPIETPADFLPRLQELAEQTIVEIRSLQRDWPVTIYGKPEALLEAA